MFFEDERRQLRFNMSGMPQPGGAPGDYEEKLSQWFLERSFFRDFTYRNPKGKKKGQELADAAVLFGDVAILVEVKAQYGNREAHAWATEAALKALTQVRKTYDDLASGAIPTLNNDVYGNLRYDPAAYPNVYGIIILAHESAPYDAHDLIPEINESSFPVHVFSLNDIALITERFDTAADFVNFLELRTDMRKRVKFLVNDEANNLSAMIPLVRAIYAQHMQPITEAMLDKTVEAFRKSATGELLTTQAWGFSIAIDDMIARAHDQDPALPWNDGRHSVSADVARFLGWLTRERRIKIGSRLIANCALSAKDGEAHYFSHFQKSRGTASVYLVSNLSREERVKYLQFLVAYAQYKYGAPQCFGVVTEPIGAGRSYDYMLTRKTIPKEAIGYFKTIDDPFDSNNEAL
jgi:hypothetical protein